MNDAADDDVPRCANCRAPIRKRTCRVFVEEREPDPASAVHHANSEFWRHVYPGRKLRSKADCQAFSNHAVVSVDYHTYQGDRYVWSFSTWDGETYAPAWSYFCTNTCAAEFGRTAVHAGFARRRAARGAQTNGQTINQR